MFIYKNWLSWGYFFFFNLSSITVHTHQLFLVGNLILGVLKKVWDEFSTYKSSNSDEQVKCIELLSFLSTKQNDEYQNPVQQWRCIKLLRHSCCDLPPNPSRYTPYNLFFYLRINSNLFNFFLFFQVIV